MGWITLECTSPCLGMWSVDFFFSFFLWGGEKPKTQSPSGVQRAERRSCSWQVGSWAALRGTWCPQVSAHVWGQCQAGGKEQEGRHQRARRTVGKFRFLIRPRAQYLWKVLCHGSLQQRRHTTCCTCVVLQDCSPTRFPCCLPNKRCPRMAFSYQYDFKSRAGSREKLY